MANFDEAFKLTMGHEGGYANDPDDLGGETYMGISRRFHPSWQGWYLVDRLQEDSLLEQTIKSLKRDLQAFVQNFYREHFWDRIAGDEITSELIAFELFDTAVNMSVHRSVKFLQQSLNCLNRKELLFPNLVEDGIMGGKTLAALRRICEEGDEITILKMMNCLQGCFYMQRMKENESQEKYARGWFKRVEIQTDAYSVKC